MNLDQDAIAIKLNQLLKLIQQHAFFLGILGFGILYGYIIVQISSITNEEPEQSQVTAQLETVPRPKLNKEDARTIQGLESQNVNVQAIFNQARENPFSEE